MKWVSKKSFDNIRRKKMFGLWINDISPFRNENCENNFIFLPAYHWTNGLKICSTILILGLQIRPKTILRVSKNPEINKKF